MNKLQGQALADLVDAAKAAILEMRIAASACSERIASRALLECAAKLYAALPEERNRKKKVNLSGER